MLSYRHHFHAGNHADVLKHIIQSLIITSMKEKEKPFLYLDSHAGAGCYRLLDMGKNGRVGEHLEGIARVWNRADAPDMLTAYIDSVKAVNPEPMLRFYPGSPMIARHLLRDCDRLSLSELHPSDFPLLQSIFQNDKRAQVTRTNGYQQLKAKLPPLSRRALILIDPSYEIKSDYQDVINAIKEGYRRFTTGIFALWYPIVFRRQIKQMEAALKSTGIRRVLQIELAVQPDTEKLGMTGSGMIVINPPWKLEQEVRALLPWLHRALVREANAETKVRWLVPE